jgi:dsRNA-specific ribonuclease
MLNVLVNCKEFENHLDKKKLPESVRTVRNKLMHCATMSLSDTEMQGMIEQVIALLEDNKELKHEKISQDKVKIIKSLRDNEFELKAKHEEVCIGTVLETYALAADTGEEIDENMMSLHEKLIKLIKGNKDLEKKFDDKLKNIDEKVTNMKQEYDAEFSIMIVSLGELKGRIESLEKNQASGQSFPSNSAGSLIGNEIKSLYKAALHSYAQKKKLDLPKYETIEIEGKRFVSTVCFEGTEFKSNAPKPSKKEAEQNAAEQALQFIGNEDLEVSNEKNDSPSAEHQVIDNKSTSQQKDKNCKNLLQEIAQKKKIPNPIYNSTQAESGFSSEVMFDGQWYHPDISPQKKKVDAEQKAAHFVLACLDR